MNAARRARQKARKKLQPDTPETPVRRDVTVTAGVASASGAADPSKDSEA